MAGLTQALGKLSIEIVDKDARDLRGFERGRFEVPFNPTELGFEKSTRFAEVAIPGLDAPVLQWVRGEGETIQIELFFDLTDHMLEGLLATSQDVRKRYVQPLESLMLQHPRLHAPPRIALRWGPHRIIERGVVQSLSVTYNLFDGLGRPVRGTARLSVREDTTAPRQVANAGRNSPDLPTLIRVRAGDTLAAIAYREYRDASQWRTIAEANRLANPLAIQPGQELLLPKVV
ncbi:MAG: LysM peptidoglycan-binding domain-containing protein [Myxococcota bacterium]